MVVNGEPVSGEIEGRLLLVHFLRDTLGLTGTHWGCDTSNCGVCVVLMDGEPVKSCTVLAAMAGGHEIRTVEDLAAPPPSLGWWSRSGGADVTGPSDPAGDDDALDVVQRGFIACHGLQCGFCTPAMLLTARALLDRNPNPTEDEIRQAIAGTICRCTGYASIVRAIQWAAAEQAGTRVSVPAGEEA
ncbi:MAG: (2Fe-2S)-binding protein [Frankia sp.]|nr:(2Fe-2S)-binding protein [Frankia sp.]